MELVRTKHIPKTSPVDIHRSEDELGSRHTAPTDTVWVAAAEDVAVGDESSVPDASWALVPTTKAAAAASRIKLEDRMSSPTARLRMCFGGGGEGRKEKERRVWE